jgi:hypothetical protein
MRNRPIPLAALERVSRDRNEAVNLNADPAPQEQLAKRRVGA